MTPDFSALPRPKGINSNLSYISNTYSITESIDPKPNQIPA
jgi:hypothetical protein